MRPAPAAWCRPGGRLPARAGTPGAGAGRALVAVTAGGRSASTGAPRRWPRHCASCWSLDEMGTIHRRRHGIPPCAAPPGSV